MFNRRARLRNCPPSEKRIRRHIHDPSTALAPENYNEIAAHRIISSLWPLAPTARNRRHQFIRHANLRIGRLAQHVTLVIHIIDHHEFPESTCAISLEKKFIPVNAAIRRLIDSNSASADSFNSFGRSAGNGPYNNSTMS